MKQPINISICTPKTDNYIKVSSVFGTSSSAALTLTHVEQFKHITQGIPM